MQTADVSNPRPHPRPAAPPPCLVQVGAEYAASIVEQERQVESLQVRCLSSLCLPPLGLQQQLSLPLLLMQVLERSLSSLANQGLNFEGISMQLYHPAVSAMTGEWTSQGTILCLCQWGFTVHLTMSTYFSFLTLPSCSYSIFIPHSAMSQGVHQLP